MNTEQAIGEGWVTVDEAAAGTGYKVAYLRRLLADGVITGKLVGRSWLVNLEAAQAYRARMDALGTAKHGLRRPDPARPVGQDAV